MKEKKLAIFLPRLGGGGAERIMVLLANQSVARGLQVDLVLNTLDGPYIDDVDPRVRIIELGALRVWKVLPRLVSYFRTHRPHAALSTLYRQNFLVILAHRVARSKARLVVREANTFSRQVEHERENLSRLRRAKGQIDLQILPRLYPLTDRVIAISEGVRQDLIHFLGLSPDHVETIHNPIDLDSVTTQGSIAEDGISKSEEVPLILSMGRLEAQKDFPTLLRGFAEARKVRPMKLIILGEGSQREALRELARELSITDDLQMPGFLKNPFATIKKADLFCLASRWEGFGNVFIEALALGVPVVATDCPSGPAEILENGTYGSLVPVGDSAALAKAILQELEAPRDKEILRRRASFFSAHRVVPKYWQALDLATS